jgi:hypothetical protein
LFARPAAPAGQDQQDRLLRALLDADKPPAPIDVLATLQRAVNDYVNAARFAPAA